MRPQKRRLLLPSTAVAAVIAALAVAPVAGAKPPTAKTVSKNVIVVLKDQHSSVKPKRGGGRNNQRARVIATDQSGVVAAARRLGATRIRQFNVVNAFSATLSTSKIAQLSRDSNVAAVVPDLPVTRSAVTKDAGKVKAAAAGIPTSTYCSTDPTSPRLEPEALQIMHVAYDDRSTPSAAKLEDGSGVKVGWIADGLDVNNPDFIRANGQHVFVDYQDFSGDGLDAPTDAEEAFGDASSIAAQGRQTYNLNDFASAANPLPDGCYVRIRGVAPGASLVGLKVFGNSNSAPTSHVISAIQYAVVTAGVDVLNESFGADPYPDNMDDPISLVNDAAILAGVTVVSSTGDSGTNGTTGSPATSSQVIGVAGTTIFRSAAQIKIDGFSNPAAGIKGWANDNISSLSSGGYAHDGKVPDVSAPGDAGWALCTPDLDLYTGCAGEDGNPTPMQLFGGTSESSPLTAGTAALVIAAYKRAHGGARPSPAQVKSIIVGTAQDLGHPAFEQGAGEVDALAAVKAALSIPAPGGRRVPSTATGVGLVSSTNHLGVNQLDLSGPAGSTVSGKYTLTNASALTQTVSLRTRSLTRTLSTQDGHIKLNRGHTFPNVVGSPRAFKFIDVVVPPGADRLDGSIAMDQSPFTVFFALIDPFGIFQAYNSPQGIANFSHIDVRYPAPGHWKAMVWANPAFTGDGHNINFEFTTSRYTSYGKVSPSSVTLTPGASATINASFPTGTNAGDSSAAIMMKSPLGASADMPVSIRTLIPTSAATNTFHGVLTGGNGRGFDAESHKYFLDIPAGKKAVSVTIKLTRPQYPNEVFIGFLVGPNGHTLSAKSNLIVNDNNEIDVGTATFNFVRSPAAGRWTFVLLLTTPSGGDVVNQPFMGTLRFSAAAISATLPTTKTTLTRGKTYRFAVKVTNSSAQQQLYFADPRLDKNTQYHLASQTPGDDLQNVTLPNPENLPRWLVPTSTSAVKFTANATLPVGLDVEWTYGDPEVFGSPQGNSASVNISASPEVTSGPWSGDPGEPGPFNGPAPKGTVALNAIATTRAFDFDADSSVGDYWLSSLIAAPAPAAAQPVGVASIGHHNRYLTAAQKQAGTTPVHKAVAATVPACDPAQPILDPGQSCTITFTITPSAPHGATVEGHLHIQTLDFFAGTTNDLSSLAYAYKVK